MIRLPTADVGSPIVSREFFLLSSSHILMNKNDYFSNNFGDRHYP